MSYSDCCFLSVPREGYRLVWEVTQYCPFSCEYCFTWSSPRRKKFEADIHAMCEGLQRFVDVIPVQDVLITGGEPLSVLQYISGFLTFLNSRGKTFSLSTTVYSEELFKEHAAPFHPRAVNISIDPPPNDRRVNSSFKSETQAAREKISIVASHNIPIKINSVISEKNYLQVGALLPFLSQLLDEFPLIQKVCFSRVYNVGSAAEAVPLSKGKLRTAFNRIAGWADAVPEVRKPIALVNWDSFHAPLGGCPAGTSVISIMPNGDVSPCSLLYNLSRSYSVGNILTDPLGDIRFRLEDFGRQVNAYAVRTLESTCTEPV